jgi:hypothetical protein
LDDDPRSSIWAYADCRLFSLPPGGLVKAVAGRKSTSLRSQIKTIVEAIEAVAPGLVAKLEEIDRQTEIEHQKRLAEQERWRREDDGRRVEQSIADSKAELRQIIERWSDVMSVARFLAGVEQQANDLLEIDKRHVLERLALARSFLGSQDPLDFFRSWKTPEERYTPRYPREEQEGKKAG